MTRSLAALWVLISDETQQPGIRTLAEEVSVPAHAARSTQQAPGTRQQAAEHCAHGVSPVEAEQGPGEITVAIFREPDGAVGPDHGRLHIGDADVDRMELLVDHAGLAAAGDLSVMHRTQPGGDREAAQPVGQGRRIAQQSASWRLVKITWTSPFSEGRQLGSRLLSPPEDLLSRAPQAAPSPPARLSAPRPRVP